MGGRSMSLRTKLLLSLALAIILGISLASWVVYRFAGLELETSKRRVMAQDAEIMARQIEVWLQKSKSDVILWAELPLVRQVALKPGDPQATAAACRFFQHIVQTTGEFQTVDLLGPDAACLASSTPACIGGQPLQMSVAGRRDFQQALKGRVSISSLVSSLANGRPLTSITVPVWRGRKVIAVLRTVIYSAFFDAVLPKQGKFGPGRSYGIIDLSLKNQLPKSLALIDGNRGSKSRPWHFPLTQPEFSGTRGFIQYHTPKGDILAAFHRVKGPDWIIVVPEPFQKVLAPIRNMGRMAFLTAILLIGAVFGVLFLMVNPGLRAIRQCLELVQKIGAGDLDARLHFRANDEIGKLAKGLNAMASRLASNRRALVEAERTYRGIFENAVEGIFRATGEQRLITVNPSFAHIMGYESTQDLIGSPLSTFFADPGQQDAFLAELQSRGAVAGLEFTFMRRDGTRGFGTLFARAAKNSAGQIVLIQGMLADTTEKQKAARQQQRAEKAESRLTQSRLQSLRYQINPHFLFNILNSIDALAKQAPQRIPELIRELSRYLRFTLMEQTDGLVPLNLELDAITSYLKLEKIRFEDDLVVEIITSPEYGQALVPELLIQPLVENAIKYGMKTSALPLRIVIRCILRNGRLEVTVANTGKWISEQEPGPDKNGIGLQNLRQRLELLYPDTHNLTSETRDGWIIAKVELPLTRTEAHVH
jgi:PAS domain S-box-containing protein